MAHHDISLRRKIWSLLGAKRTLFGIGTDWIGRKLTHNGHWPASHVAVAKLAFAPIKVVA